MPFTKHGAIIKEQELLFYLESVLDIHSLENLNVLFDELRADHLASDHVVERKPFSHQSLLRAIIYKKLNGLSILTDSFNELTSNRKDYPMKKHIKYCLPQALQKVLCNKWDHRVPMAIHQPIVSGHQLLS
jgi:hypothetical protein